LCEARINDERGEASRPYNGGRAHMRCIKSHTSCHATSQTDNCDLTNKSNKFSFQHKREVLRSVHPSLEPLACKSLKPLNQLGTTQANKRRNAYRAIDDFVRSRLDINEPIVNIDKHAALRLNGSVRRSIRNACIDGVHLPCETTLNKLRKALGVDKGTKSSFFTIEVPTDTTPLKIYGAFVVDPIHLVESLSRDGDFLAVSGDYGGRHTSLSI
jgi:hypothetical protein